MMSSPLSTVMSFNRLVKNMRESDLSNVVHRRNCQKLALEQNWERSAEAGAKWIHTLSTSELIFQCRSQAVMPMRRNS